MTQTYEVLDNEMDTPSRTTVITQEHAGEHAHVASASETAMASLTPQQRLAVELRRRQILAAQATRRAQMEQERQRAQRRAGERSVATSGTTMPVSVVITAHPKGEEKLSLRAIQGSVLRELRTRDHRTLREVSQKAGVSLGYLSEVERGQKEASSELLVSITKALGVPLSQVLMMIAKRVEAVEQSEQTVTAHEQ